MRRGATNAIAIVFSVHNRAERHNRRLNSGLHYQSHGSFVGPATGQGMNTKALYAIRTAVMHTDSFTLLLMKGIAHLG
jgi:hypothetical protein